MVLGSTVASDFKLGDKQVEKIMLGGALVWSGAVVPAAPLNLVASDTETDQITVTWDAVTADPVVTEYEVFKDGVALATLPASPLVYSVSAGTFSFTVRARNATGQSGDSNVDNGTSVAPVVQLPPSAPVLTSVVDANYNNNSVEVDYVPGVSGNGNPVRHDMYGSNGDYWANIQLRSFNASGIDCGVSQSYTIECIDEVNGLRALSNAISATVACPAAMIPITDFNAVGTSDGTGLIAVSWSNYGDADLYEVYSEETGYMESFSSGSSSGDVYTTIGSHYTMYVIATRTFDGASVTSNTNVGSPT